jgi:hypothetical protein
LLSGVYTALLALCGDARAAVRNSALQTLLTTLANHTQALTDTAADYLNQTKENTLANHTQANTAANHTKGTTAAADVKDGIGGNVKSNDCGSGGGGGAYAPLVGVLFPLLRRLLFDDDGEDGDGNGVGSIRVGGGGLGGGGGGGCVRKSGASVGTRRGGRKEASVGTRRGGRKVLLLVHHSGDTAAKQWNQTR